MSIEDVWKATSFHSTHTLSAFCDDVLSASDTDVKLQLPIYNRLLQ
jgi:hypothetical protein